MAVPGKSPLARAAILQLVPLPKSRKMVAGAMMRSAAYDRRRGHADDRHETARTLHSRQANLMIMAVDDKLGTGAADQSLETACIHKAAPKVRAVACGGWCSMTTRTRPRRAVSVRSSSAACNWRLPKNPKQ